MGYLAQAMKAREEVLAYSFKEVTRRVEVSVGNEIWIWNLDRETIVAAIGHVELPNRLIKLGLAGEATYPRWPYCEGQVIFRSPEFSEFTASSQETICFERHPALLAHIDGFNRFLDETDSGWQIGTGPYYMYYDPIHSPESLIEEALTRSESGSARIAFSAASETSSGFDEISISWSSRTGEDSIEVEFNIGIGNHDRLIRNLSMVTFTRPLICDGPVCITDEWLGGRKDEIQIEFFDYKVKAPGTEIESSSDRAIRWSRPESGIFGSDQLDQLFKQVWQLAKIESVPSESSALVSLYRATGGQEWSNDRGWLTDQPLSTWHGVTTDANGRVIGLDLSDNNLIGELPPAIQQFTFLESLDLNGNELSGPIPAELGNLTRLQFLDLGSNRLAGILSPELGKLANLQVLNVARNRIAAYPSDSGIGGQIPPELGSLAQLLKLDLSKNRFDGEIPPELASLSELRKLVLSDNALAGEIPPEFGNLRNLRELNLSRNDLEGGIPPEFGNLRNLRELNLSYNALEGSLPSDLAQLHQLERLIVSYNNLSLNRKGAIPPELRELLNSRSLSVAGQGVNHDHL